MSNNLQQALVKFSEWVNLYIYNPEEVSKQMEIIINGKAKSKKIVDELNIKNYNKKMQPIKKRNINDNCRSQSECPPLYFTDINFDQSNEDILKIALGPLLQMETDDFQSVVVTNNDLVFNEMDSVSPLNTVQYSTILNKLKEVINNNINLYIIKDKELEKHCLAIMTYYGKFVLKDMSTNDFLHIGCSTMKLTYDISKYISSNQGLLPVNNRGIDFAYRRLFPFHNESTDNTHYLIINNENLFDQAGIHDEEYRYVILTHILPYVNCPSMLLSESIRILNQTGILILVDYDCETDEDSYNLQVKDYIFAQFSSQFTQKNSQNQSTSIVNTQKYLPLKRFYPKNYWNDIFNESGMICIEKFEDIGPYKMFMHIYTFRDDSIFE